MDELSKINCEYKEIFCSNDNDCLQICSNAINDNLQTQYKCSEIKTCIQSKIESTKTSTEISCNRDYGFIPILTADEFFQYRWICLNTLPYIFNDNQEFHKYICDGGNKNQLDIKDLYNSCKCPSNKIKVRDEFRNTLPICVDKHQLSLFPNFRRD